MECEVLTTTEDCSSSENEEDDYPGLSKMSRVFQQHWKETRENPHHFNVWTKLVAYAESEKSLAACRKAYDAFLEKYPLCHIYWKKYIEVEQRLGNAKDAEKVFDRALKSQPYNVVMWVHYIHFLKQNMDMTLKESADKLRSVFQEAVKLCGLDFYSDELWQLYIDFETEQGNLKDAASLYDRVLFVPTQQYLTHYARFKKFISTYSPLDFLAKEECTWVYSTIQEESDANQVASEDADDLSEFVTDSDKAKIVGQILKVREQLCILNKAEVVKRVPFEDTIKRRHFYAAPLNIKQLTIWRKYLEFEVSQGQHERIVLLYERCLMPCAFYEEFWLTYAQYMENKSVEAARGIFERACRINFPQKYILHVQWAAFEEKHGCLESARGILREAEKALPNLAILRLKRVALERRNGNLLEAEKLLMEAKQNSTDVKLSSFYATKLSRLILTLQGDLHKARSVLTDAIQKDPDNPKLYLCLLEVEMSEKDPGDGPLKCVEQALSRNLPVPVKAVLSQRRLELLEDFGSSLKSWLDAYTEHQTFITPKTQEGRKDEDALHPPGVTPPPKKSKTPDKESKADAEPSSYAQSDQYNPPPRLFAPPQRTFAPAAGFSGDLPSFPSDFQTPPVPAIFNNPPHFIRPRFFNNLPHFRAGPYFNNPSPFNIPPLLGTPGIHYRMNVNYDLQTWYQNFSNPFWNRNFPPH